jgi:hypothetical protein
MAMSKKVHVERNQIEEKQRKEILPRRNKKGGKQRSVKIPRKGKVDDRLIKHKLN